MLALETKDCGAIPAAGVTEVWDTNEDEFQCAGVAATRNTLQPNSLSQPNYQPAPLLVYIEQGTFETPVFYFFLKNAC
jgi:hypothetical protein